MQNRVQHTMQRSTAAQRHQASTQLLYMNVSRAVELIASTGTAHVEGASAVRRQMCMQAHRRIPHFRRRSAARPSCKRCRLAGKASNCRACRRTCLRTWAAVDRVRLSAILQLSTYSMRAVVIGYSNPGCMLGHWNRRSLHDWCTWCGQLSKGGGVNHIQQQLSVAKSNSAVASYHGPHSQRMCREALRSPIAAFSEQPSGQTS